MLIIYIAGAVAFVFFVGYYFGVIHTEDYLLNTHKLCYDRDERQRKFQGSYHGKR